MVKISVMYFKCPKCHYSVKAELKRACKFVIYKCPVCDSNVVYYDNKLDIISDKMVEKLKNKKRLKLCGQALISYKALNSNKFEGITRDKIINLKILLETEKDVASFISKI